MIDRVKLKSEHPVLFSFLQKIKVSLKKIINIYSLFKGYYSLKLFGQNYKLNIENIDFWKRVYRGEWEPHTYKVMSQYLDKNSIYIDIGAWIGPTVIYAAKKSKQVICFEPDPIAFRRLTSNIYLNNLDNVSSYNVAISDKCSIQKMSSFGGSLGDTMTSLISRHNKSSSSFNALVLDWNMIEKIHNFKKVDFIKIDIEGAEFFLIPKLEKFFMKFQPVVWLSIHVNFLNDEVKLKELQRLMDVMNRCYKICLNSKFQPVNINDFPNNVKMRLKHTYLFKN